MTFAHVYHLESKLQVDCQKMRQYALHMPKPHTLRPSRYLHYELDLQKQTLTVLNLFLVVNLIHNIPFLEDMLGFRES